MKRVMSREYVSEEDEAAEPGFGVPGSKPTSDITPQSARKNEPKTSVDRNGLIQ